MRECLQQCLFLNIYIYQTLIMFFFLWVGWVSELQIDRLLPVAGKEQMTEFGHLFSNTSQRNIADGHLWFSVFLRPPRSRFTRLQRVGCCVAFLYLSMLVNAMWYGTVDTGSGKSAFKLGPFSISTEQVSRKCSHPRSAISTLEQP